MKKRFNYAFAVIPRGSTANKDLGNVQSVDVTNTVNKLIRKNADVNLAAGTDC